MRMPTPPSPLKLILSTLSFLLWPALILFLAGDWRWPEGWILGRARAGRAAATRSSSIS
jgi:hypothetical protein